MVMRDRIRRALSDAFGLRQAVNCSTEAEAVEPVQPAGTIARVSPPPALDTAFAVPFDFNPSLPVSHPAIAVLAHLFYVDLTPELFSYLRNIPVPADVFLTTDTPEKRDAILAHLPEWPSGRMEVRVVPNRGRDIAPKLVGLVDVHRRYELVLHLHGKKSQHWQHGQAWRHYLYEVLLGSPDVVRSILAAFVGNSQLGLVLPLHWEPVRPFVDWGFDYQHCREFGRRLGIEVSRDQPLDFPSGSMFWARSAALKGLLDLDLSFDHFPREGFTGGTLAHVIERLYVRVCEQSGHTWLKAARPDLSPKTEGIVRIGSPATLKSFLQQKPYLLGDPALRLRPPVSLPAPAVPWPRLRFLPDQEGNRRLTLLASGDAVDSTTRPGGALDIFRRVVAAAGDGVQVRVVGSPSVLQAARQLGLRHSELMPAPYTDAFPPPPLQVRAEEVLFAATWHDTADARALADNQERFYHRRPTLICLVPDGDATDPAEFLAEAEACRRPHDTLAIFMNSAIATRLQQRGRAFARCELAQPLWNPALDSIKSETDSSAERAQMLLVDWWPSLPNSLAGLTAAAIGRWLEQDPASARHWTIYGIGEPGEDVPLAAGRILRSLGQPAPEKYAALLWQARLGISLTLGRGPSRIALEMAACGVATVISPRSLGYISRPEPGLVPASDLDVGSVTAALAAAAHRPDNFKVLHGTAPPGFWTEADLEAMAHRVISWIGAAQSERANVHARP